jgi:hypothetical protein
MVASGSGKEFCSETELVQILVKKLLLFTHLSLEIKACDTLIDDTYMDDTIVSHPSEVDCVKLVEDLPKVTEGMDMEIQSSILTLS